MVLTLIPDSVFSPISFASVLENSEELPAIFIKEQITRVNAYLNHEFQLHKNARSLIKRRTEFIDYLLQTLWKKYECDKLDHALIACGGYGRRELFPQSDLDILILLGESKKKGLKEIEEFLTALWDLGLNLGHSVRDAKECEEKAASDITILTNLMESRPLFDPNNSLDKVLYLTSSEYMWPSDSFFNEKLKEQRSRHEKYADTEYNLEPNVKSSPGGLRDIQFIGWIAERFLGVNSLEEVFKQKFILEEDAHTLISGRDFLWDVRYGLHILSAREEDRLLFDYQRQLAEAWEYTDGNRLAVEKFMQTYYRWALAIGQLNEILVLRFEQAILRTKTKKLISRIDADYVNINGYLDLTKDGLIEEKPNLLLLTFKVLANDSKLLGPSAKTIQAIRNNIHLIDSNFRKEPKNRKTFLDILKSPHGMTLQLRRMNRYGVLSAYLPAFGRIVGQMQHDLFHVYTVDAHTLEVIQNMRRFINGKHDEKFPVSSRIARRLPKIELLYIAGLFHDIGKGRGGDHSSLGAIEAREFCVEHRLDEKDIGLVTWLVENHLLMSSVAQRKDISDPFVIKEFANAVENENRLNYLFTLTVADITGTNPNLWNAWRGSLIRQLYNEARRAINQGLGEEISEDELALSTKKEAGNILESRGFSQEELSVLWNKLGRDYFIRESGEDIAWHTEARASHKSDDIPLVLVKNTNASSVANATQIFIFTKPTHHLFSITCGELEALELSVHDARIYSDQLGMVLYNFSVLNLDGSTLEANQPRLKIIEQHLQAALLRGQKKPRLVKRRTPRQKKSFRIATKTSLYEDVRQNVSILEVASRDRPGLLAKIAIVFEENEVILKAAKIQTLGERVEDIFFLTTVENKTLKDQKLCETIQNSICNELDKGLNS